MTDTASQIQNAITITGEVSIEEMGKYQQNLLKFIGQTMREGEDFGLIPGTSKKSLWQPGADKLCKLLGLAPKNILTKEVENFETGFLYYRYKCEVYHINSNKFVGDAERSCNSMEESFYLESVYEPNATPEQKQKAVKRFQPRGKNYFLLKVPKSTNELLAQQNNVMSRAQKRAYVAAVRAAAMANEIFSVSDGVDEENGPKNYGKTNPKDEEINQLRAKLYAVARERGIDNDQVHDHICKSFKVQSTKDLTPDQYRKYTDKLITSFAIVKPGETPRKLGA